MDSVPEQHLETPAPPPSQGSAERRRPSLPPSTLGILAALTVAAAVLRFWGLDLQSFTHDEAVTVAVLNPDFGDMLDFFARRERSGPLYYVLAWLWSNPFGTDEVGLRSLSALFGTLTVPVAYVAASELASRRAGLIAAGLVAANPYFFWYSQEARSYSLWVLIAAVGFLFFARSLQHPTKRNFAWWAVASALSLCTHYFGVFLVAPQGLWLIIATRSRYSWRALAAVTAVGLMLLPLAINARTHGGLGFQDDPLSVRVVDAGAGFVAGEMLVLDPGPYYLGATVGSLALAAAGAALGAVAFLMLVRRGPSRERRNGFTAAAIGALAFACPVVLVKMGIDYLIPRNLMGALLPLLVAAAIGCGTARSRRLGFACALALIFLFSASSIAILAKPELQRTDWRGIAQSIGPPHTPRMIVVPRGGDSAIQHYLARARLIHTSQWDRPKTVKEIDIATTAPSAPHSLRSGFELFKRRVVRQYNVFRYRSAGPRAVAPDQLTLEGLLPGSFTVMLQSPDLGDTAGSG